MIARHDEAGGNSRPGRADAESGQSRVNWRRLAAASGFNVQAARSIV